MDTSLALSRVERQLEVGLDAEQIDYHGCSQRRGGSGRDFFVFERDRDGDLVMMMGTLAAAGMNSDLLATGLRVTFSSLLKSERDLAIVVRDLNRMMWDVSPGGVFSALFCARMDARTRVLEYVNAGEVLAMLITARSSRGRHLRSSGAVLGLSRQSHYVQHRMACSAGDCLVAISDGLADASVSPGRILAELLPKLFETMAITSAEDVAAQLMGKVQAATQPAADRTIAVLCLPCGSAYRAAAA